MIVLFLVLLIVAADCTLTCQFLPEEHTVFNLTRRNPSLLQDSAVRVEIKQRINEYVTSYEKLTYCFFYDSWVHPRNNWTTMCWPCNDREYEKPVQETIKESLAAHEAIMKNLEKMEAAHNESEQELAEWRAKQTALKAQSTKDKIVRDVYTVFCCSAFVVVWFLIECTIRKYCFGREPERIDSVEEIERRAREDTIDPEQTQNSESTGTACLMPCVITKQ